MPAGTPEISVLESIPFGYNSVCCAVYHVYLSARHLAASSAAVHYEPLPATIHCQQEARALHWLLSALLPRRPCVRIVPACCLGIFATRVQKPGLNQPHCPAGPG